MKINENALEKLLVVVVLKCRESGPCSMYVDVETLMLQKMELKIECVASMIITV